MIMAFVLVTSLVTFEVSADAAVETNAFNEFVTESFEDGTVGSLTIQNAGDGADDPVVEAGMGYKGSYGVSLDYTNCTTSIAGFRVIQKQAVANTEYELSLKIKYPVGNTPSGKMSFIVYNQNNRQMSYANLSYTALEDGWYLAEGTGIYPGNDTTNLTVDIRINENFIQRLADTIYVDDIMLSPVEKNVGHNEPVSFEWNAGDSTLNFPTTGWNKAQMEVQNDGRVKITSTANNNGLDVTVGSNLFSVVAGNMYRIELIGEVKGTLSTSIGMPFTDAGATYEVLSNGKYRIVRDFIADATKHSYFIGGRIFCGFGVTDGTDLYLETLRVTDFGKVNENVFGETYAYAIDTNNQYAYGLIDKEIVIQEATDDTEAVTETRVVVQQFNLD